MRLTLAIISASITLTLILFGLNLVGVVDYFFHTTLSFESCFNIGFIPTYLMGILVLLDSHFVVLFDIIDTIKWRKRQRWIDAGLEHLLPEIEFSDIDLGNVDPDAQEAVLESLAKNSKS
mgnify:CR=1 FL=1